MERQEGEDEGRGGGQCSGVERGGKQGFVGSFGEILRRVHHKFGAQRDFFINFVEYIWCAKRPSYKFCRIYIWSTNEN
jgi:hypothetical protein